MPSDDSVTKDHVEGNGTPVTWRELNLALDPIKHGMDTMMGQLNILVAERNERIGAQRLQRNQSRVRIEWFQIGVAAAAAVLGGAISSVILIYLS